MGARAQDATAKKKQEKRREEKRKRRKDAKLQKRKPNYTSEIGETGAPDVELAAIVPVPRESREKR